MSEASMSSASIWGASGLGASIGASSASTLNRSIAGASTARASGVASESPHAQTSSTSAVYLTLDRRLLPLPLLEKFHFLAGRGSRKRRIPLRKTPKARDGIAMLARLIHIDGPHAAQRRRRLGRHSLDIGDRAVLQLEIFRMSERQLQEHPLLE